MKKSQEKWVVEQLEKRGHVSRNQALRKYISRLAAHIGRLKAVGYEFTTQKVKNDYKYVLTKRP